MVNPTYYNYDLLTVTVKDRYKAVVLNTGRPHCDLVCSVIFPSAL